MENLKILVIDDDPTTCSLLETILQMEDYRTATAKKVDPDIMAVLNREKPDILIMDFHLGSHETVRHITAIRASTDWQHLPILMTSAIDRRRDCLAAGANGFILKPFQWQEFTKSVNNLRDNLTKEV